jgi:hypothetical protein
MLVSTHLQTKLVSGEYIEKLKLITEHVPKHLKPLSDDEFCHYLAGLIDGDGHFNKQGHLIITFDYLSASLGYYLKSRLEYGTVNPVKGKKAYTLIISYNLLIFY